MRVETIGGAEGQNLSPPERVVLRSRPRRPKLCAWVKQYNYNIPFENNVSKTQATLWLNMNSLVHEDDICKCSYVSSWHCFYQYRITVYLADCIYLNMDWSRFGCMEPEPEPEPPEPVHFTRSRSRSRRDMLLGAVAGARAEIVHGAGAGAVPKLHGSASLLATHVLYANFHV